MIKGAIFDMDGTLVANSPVHIRAFEIFCDRYGVRGWKEKLGGAFGMGNDDIMRLIMPEEVIREKGLAALGDEKEAVYREIYAPEIEPMPGLVALLGKLRDAGIRCAVGSSGCRANVDFVLEKCESARRAGAGRIVALASTHSRQMLAAETDADVIIGDFRDITDLETLLK